MGFSDSLGVQGNPNIRYNHVKHIETKEGNCRMQEEQVGGQKKN